MKNLMWASSITNLLLTFIIGCLILACITLVKNLIEKSLLKKKGELYIAIRLLLESQDDVNKAKIIDINIKELDREIELIINDDYINKNLSSSILKSKLYYINRYYIKAREKKIYEKEKARAFLSNKTKATI